MVQAVATADVPKLTVIVGASHGAGNYAMCGRGYDPRFLFVWPGARISVMGARQAAQVLTTVKAQQRERAHEPWTEDDRKRISASILSQYEQEASPYFGTARLWDDGVIDPVDTRRVLGLCLDVAMTTPVPESHPPVFRM
jgi:3-methylcrotonyl-CoA carboxylase beta subunit